MAGAVMYGTITGSNSKDPRARIGWSGGNGQLDQLPGRLIGAVEMPAGVDQLGELRFADGEARSDGTDASSFFLEIPDEFAARPFSCEAPSIFGEIGRAHV